MTISNVNAGAATSFRAQPSQFDLNRHRADGSSQCQSRIAAQANGFAPVWRGYIPRVWEKAASGSAASRKRHPTASERARLKPKHPPMTWLELIFATLCGFTTG
ncbi:hypothetical protein LGH83_07590 [Lichenihabitans sp. PAMC28606]|uniref:hypothetical protein n=1 Tax=Lichenihabitans sp. PAMC28606 TaxID=2880932 RepID=UPI001D0A1161|nr:hypothetical protein [Lichenihabitans sp. PAMC28606]UDL96048.1 hypothetical protein LGH83_07590 [Lichenihabitans sp. PAMC28606]